MPCNVESSIVLSGLLLSSLSLLAAASTPANAGDDRGKRSPLVIDEQGSFLRRRQHHNCTRHARSVEPATPPDGQTFRGDHAYVQYQIPEKHAALPIVMWHGGGQMAKTWETTPDGREGFLNTFLRRDFSVYILDQPRRGRAGRSMVAATINPTPRRAGDFTVFRLGVWPNYFPGVQFSRSPAVLDQYFRQQTPNIGAGDDNVASDAGGGACSPKSARRHCSPIRQAGLPGGRPASRHRTCAA